MTKPPAKVYVVFDTNVYVRAIAGLEEEHAAWGAMVRICHSLVVSQDISDEYYRVINRYGYNSWLIIIKGEELKAMQKLKELPAEMDTGMDVEVEVPEKDLPFLKAAIVAGASYLVTQDDRHFLSKKVDIKAKHNITVVSPREYYDICKYINEV